MKRLSALLLAFACIASLQADPLASRNRASIDASGTYRGNFALNQAAGDAQQQSNVRVVAVGSAALVGSDQRQHLQLDASQPIAASASQPIAASASISGAALRGSGILGVNQGAGLGNQQINAFRLSVSNGPESLDDSVLAQSVALTKVSGSATPVPGGRSVSTDDRAFAGSSGVVQVNQSAGVGNQSMNTLSVRVME
ncbi:adhesin [Pseudomonas aeruginosa]|uniref:adhesin n=1 Tax=Pseudomonas aeruginosa TaxID=287 RepID=UPI00403B0D95